MSAALSTLIEAVRYFADEDVALAFLANIRWPDGQQECATAAPWPSITFLSEQRRWKCRACRKQFSIKIGTIFEDSPIKLSQWLPAVGCCATARTASAAMSWPAPSV